MLVKMQQDSREFKNETQAAIHALVDAQMRTDAKLNRLIESLSKRSNGRGH